MSDAFDPDDVAEIEQLLNKAEIEETSTVCSYSEMTYESARKLIDTADIYLNGVDLVERYSAGVDLVSFALVFIESIRMMLEDGEPTD